MNREWLSSELAIYASHYTEEIKYTSRFLDLLFFEDCYHRSRLSGHITASAWTLTSDYSHVAMLHHKKLDRWLQPGGHADGNENVLEVAKKELREETGVSDIKVVGRSFYDLDIHSIPERKGIQEHEHFDVRFMFIANNPEQLKKNNESFEVAWIPLAELDNLVDREASIMRMKHKTLALHDLHR
ncbi:MAG: NUDIX hydrolase [Reichenbachiella sp.]|uniref:NUDIX hydrolase n=1 Tax=Reichenbachiella sp. TaxID=2184521 RepID=UPI003263D6B8